jgi:intracellular multiplication protein IcmL
MATPAASAPRLSAQEGAVLNEQTAIARFERLKNLVRIEAWVILGLCVALVLLLPFAQPVYLYLSLTPEKKVAQMTGLTMPNMTNRAVLAWSTTSITEILTMGFGDIDMRLPKQKIRFTPDGWDSYTKFFTDAKIGQTFKQNQLVLTTVPSNTPVILAQGVNDDHIYQWVVQMPVIMTYATNNNVQSQNRKIITLTIVRVPANVSPDGIAIQRWISS